MKSDIPEIQFTKGESLIAYAQLLIENRDAFHADEVTTELAKADVLESLNVIQEKLKLEDNSIKGILLVMLMKELIDSFVKDNESLYKLFKMLFFENGDGE